VISQVNLNILIGCITGIIAVSILSYTVYETVTTEKRLMHTNIESAINKGIDPIAVRCSYANPTDNVCLAYAITHNTVDAPPAPLIQRKK
jgi:hypothetical protein